MKNDASCRTAQGNIILLTQNKYDLIYTIIRNSYNSMQSKNSIQEEISKQSKNSMQSKNRRSIKTRTACIAYYKVPQASVKKQASWVLRVFRVYLLFNYENTLCRYITQNHLFFTCKDTSCIITKKLKPTKYQQNL